MRNPKVTRYSEQNQRVQPAQRAQANRAPMQIAGPKNSRHSKHQSSSEHCTVRNPKCSSRQSNRVGRRAAVPEDPGTCRGGRFARTGGRPCGFPRRRRPARGGAAHRAPSRFPAPASTPSRRAAAAAAGIEGTGFFGREGL